MIDKTVIFVKIKGMGFTFLLNKKVKCNLISPVLMSFFNIKEKQQYSFPVDNLIEVNTKSVYNDNLPFLPEHLKTINFDGVFHYIGKRVTRCSDNKFRICKIYKFEFEYERSKLSFSFLLDKSLNELAVLGKKSLKQLLNNEI